MDASSLLVLYRELQQYVAWTEADAIRVGALLPLIEPAFSEIVEDFYEEIRRHPRAMESISGGESQINRLKQTLRNWLEDLIRGPYDEAFVARRFQVGRRHVEIGLAQYYANAALSRIRGNLIRIIHERWTGSPEELRATISAFDRLLDLDLAIIEFAYQTEFTAREQRIERLATMGKIAAGIAHELRNPLNAIKTSVYYLLNAKQPTAEKQREHLERIDRQVNLSDRVITALSDFARMPQPNFESVSLPEFLLHVIETNSVPETINVTIDCADEIPQVLADPSQLSIAIGNLVRNAVDAMPQGGSLTLRASRDLSLGPQEEAPVILEVIDTGSGIPPEIVSRVMEPLFSTKARGLGLGLALCRAIVDKHNGRVTVRSQPGVGSVFSVALLPAQESAS